MEQVIGDALREWGPPGVIALVGTGAAWLIWQEYKKLVARVLGILDANTAAMTSLSTLIRDRRNGRDE